MKSRKQFGSHREARVRDSEVSRLGAQHRDGITADGYVIKRKDLLELCF
jgi:ribosomal protein L27